MHLIPNWIIQHSRRGISATFQVEWPTGDHTWINYDTAKNLIALEEYLELMGIRDVTQLHNPVLDSKKHKHKLAWSLLTLLSNRSTEQVALHLCWILWSPLCPPRLFQPSVDKKQNTNTHEHPNCKLQRVNHQQDAIHLKASGSSGDCAHSNLSLQIFKTSTLK